MSSNLDTPLRRRRGFDSLRNRLPREWPLGRTALGLAMFILIIALARIGLVDDPNGGRPTATVDISATRDTNAIAKQVATANPEQPAPLNTQSAGAPDGPQITLTDPGLPAGQGQDVHMAISELDAFGVDPALVEETQNGPIPQVASDGRTPFSTYARASTGPSGANGKPLIAIVIAGMGLNEAVTLQAVDTLPENVTLAFAPYGKTLGRTAAAARAQGHEMLLQIPLEPFDYPESDPGPKTLLVGQPPRANLDKLFWLMSRFGGYFGLMNYMGARYTASAADFEPIMEETGMRGLGYFDDGSSLRSLAPQMAARNKVPFARANFELDAKPSRAAILDKLSELEVIARDKGSAIGTASALPVSIKTIAEWARGLDDKNLLLVPVSALMTRAQAP